MALDKEQKEMIKIRELVIKKLAVSIIGDNVADALSYMALLNEILSYMEE